MADQVADTLFQYLKDMLYHPQAASLDVQSLPADFQPLGEGLLFLKKCMDENRTFSKAIERGDLNVPLPPAENTLAAPAKGIHAVLTHLTWQTKQVAAGDYTQRLSFMGEFAESFNQMVEQLAERRERLNDEKTDLEQRNRQMEKLAFLDGLTELYNRRYAMELIESLLSDRVKFCVSIVDLDNLKYCNDTYGHRAGDVYILNVVNTLKKVPGVKTLCRIGGDEFLVIKERVSAAEMDRTLYGLRRTLLEPENSRSEEPPHSFSYGTCEVLPDSPYSVEKIVSIADKQMYAFKFQHKVLPPLTKNE